MLPRYLGEAEQEQLALDSHSKNDKQDCEEVDGENCPTGEQIHNSGSLAELSKTVFPNRTPRLRTHGSPQTSIPRSVFGCLAEHACQPQQPGCNLRPGGLRLGRNIPAVVTVDLTHGLQTALKMRRFPAIILIPRFIPAEIPAMKMLSVFTLIFAARLLADDPTSEQLEFFEKKIRPVLVRECYSCHSAQAKSVKGSLLLDTREGIRRGGESGHGVVPGQLKESLIIEAIRYEGLEMPPKKQLPESVIQDLEKWVRMGAPDPRNGKSAPIRRTIDFEKARDFWSFQPIGNPTPPGVTAWSATAIDRFVLQRLNAAGLKPSPDASPRTFIRRLYFDLTGLPPSPEQANEFVLSPNPDTLRKIVDGLLESDQFGERWARHWMDVVRYAESTGMERNYTYPEAWRYRDYLIAAFNSDLPFDQFLSEQIAGDLQPSENPADRDRRLIATGMLAMGPKSLNERDREKFAMDIVDEQIDVVSRAFLGLTASCARCHDHKFDPIPQKEYYQLAGIFRSTKTFYGTGGGGGNRQGGQLLALKDDGVVPVAVNGSNRKNVRNTVKKLTTQLSAQKKRLKRFNTLPDPNARQVESTRKAIERIEQQLAKAKKDLEPAAIDEHHGLVMAVQDSANPQDTQIRVRGEANERGETVARGFLTIATLSNTAAPSDAGSGRTELTQWLLARDNPLTARVAVNRVWQHLFGQGIVRTVNNFGANGDRPSHPELLDYLATKFVDEDGWSVKSLIRRIVLSRTYRQASTPVAAAIELDPENRLLWRMNPRRLEAEALRDAVLAVSGTLDLSPGEKSIVQTVGNGDVGRNLRPAQFSSPHTKRSVYLPIVRGVVPEMLRVFDFPEPSIIAGARDVTTVPTQALYMMNSPFVTQQSTEMADRLMEERDSDAERIRYAYELALCRAATGPEVERSLEFIAAACDRNSNQKDSEAIAWAGFCQVLLASAEFRYLE